MIENAPIRRLIAHLVLVLGILVVAFPIYYMFVASTHTLQTILRPPLPLLPGKEFFTNYWQALFGGIGYRLPPPGGVIKDGKLHASSEYPGLVIRYSTDGQAPTSASPVYTQPVAVNGPVQLSTFSTRNRAGRASTVE